jgi:hypothetical protein
MKPDTDYWPPANFAPSMLTSKDKKDPHFRPPWYGPGAWKFRTSSTSSKFQYGCSTRTAKRYAKNDPDFPVVVYINGRGKVKDEALGAYLHVAGALSPGGSPPGAKPVRQHAQQATPKLEPAVIREAWRAAEKAFLTYLESSGCLAKELTWEEKMILATAAERSARNRQRRLDKKAEEAATPPRGVASKPAKEPAKEPAEEKLWFPLTPGTVVTPELLSHDANRARHGQRR